MSHTHRREECKHGSLVTQCRCMSKDKVTIVVDQCPARCPGDPDSETPDFETKDREAGLGQKSENRGWSGHRLTVSDEEMDAAAAAFDEFDSGCGQNHDPDQWKDKAQWRAALSAAYDVRMQRLADEAARGFSPEQIGEPRPGPGLGDYVQGLIERAKREAFADGQAYERQHS